MSPPMKPSPRGLTPAGTNAEEIRQTNARGKFLTSERTVMGPTTQKGPAP